MNTFGYYSFSELTVNARKVSTAKAATSMRLGNILFSLDGMAC